MSVNVIQGWTEKHVYMFIIKGCQEKGISYRGGDVCVCVCEEGGQPTMRYFRWHLSSNVMYQLLS